MRSAVVGSSPVKVSFPVWAVASGVRRWVEAWRHRGEIAAMMHLDDYMLRDIGVTRLDVQSALAQPLGRDPSRVLATKVHDNRSAARAKARQRGRVLRLVDPSR